MFAIQGSAPFSNVQAERDEELLRLLEAGNLHHKSIQRMDPEFARLAGLYE
jgi:hypothetical protein